MRTFLLIIFLYPELLFGQCKIDTVSITNALVYPDSFFKDTFQIDNRIVRTLTAFDEQYYLIAGYWKRPPYKHTIIGSGEISIRKLISKAQAMDYIINDTSQSINHNVFWKQSQPDTISFLKGIITQSDYELYYPDFQMPKMIFKVKPLRVSNSLKLKNIVFNSKELNHKIDSISKRLEANQLPCLYKFLSNNFDYFDGKAHTLNEKAVEITNITFSDNNLVYLGADIYGSHYLITFDSADNYRFVTKKELWVY